MPFDLFISYAWTSDSHREWTRLLASSLHLLGYDVALDKNVDYGSNLTGFMREVTESRHVLLVVDENYVDRADNNPESGVAVENRWIQSVVGERDSGWLSALFVGNPTFRLPSWLEAQRPKGFDFNTDAGMTSFPGSEQLADLWRWLEDLPADDTNATPLSVVRQRASRLERIADQRDPARWHNPKMSDTITFPFRDAERYIYRVGQGTFEFALSFTECSAVSVYAYKDYANAVGLLPEGSWDGLDFATRLTPGRSVIPFIGQGVVVMNDNGALCTLRIDAIQVEANDASGYVAPSVTFSYQILRDS